MRASLMALPQKRSCQRLISGIIQKKELNLDSPTQDLLYTEKKTRAIVAEKDLKMRQLYIKISKQVHILQVQREEIAHFILEEKKLFSFPHTIQDPFTSRWIQINHVDDQEYILVQMEYMESKFRTLCHEIGDITFANDKIYGMHYVLNDDRVACDLSPHDDENLKAARSGIKWLGKVKEKVENAEREGKIKYFSLSQERI